MNELTAIFVRLPDENVVVWRPVLARHCDDNVYEIAEQDYDRAIERWQFEPGDRVVCDLVESSDGKICAAVRTVSG